MVASNRKNNTPKGFAEEELKESLILGFVGFPVTRSRSKDLKLPPLAEGGKNPTTGSQTSDQEYSPEDTKVASDQKKNSKVASSHKKKNAKVASSHKKKNAKGVPKKSNKAVAKNPTPVGLTSEELQKYSREDFDYKEFHGPVFGIPPLLKIVGSQIRPIIPKYIFRGNLDVKAAMKYHNRRCNGNYCGYKFPLQMKSQVVGGGHLDFITFELRKPGGDDYEKFQAILYTAPAAGVAVEPKVLMCRPELGFTAKPTFRFMAFCIWWAPERPMGRYIPSSVPEGIQTLSVCEVECFPLSIALCDRN
ncbi:uncharacterized protein LOC131298673 isoform X3 [Rhododendron vialii]|uniref:uncharacterized protein LOC131298673 isoform X3 n=1 Tax=Rhododendron vialii TaxID=182163 RepID=UPI00266040FF|nr:uncharacterized protein LOC131298673 isoform X3 [Rhododendron vialii]